METGIEIFSDKNCKVTFGFKYSCCHVTVIKFNEMSL